MFVAVITLLVRRLRGKEMRQKRKKKQRLEMRLRKQRMQQKRLIMQPSQQNYQGIILIPIQIQQATANIQKPKSIKLLPVPVPAMPTITTIQIPIRRLMKMISFESTTICPPPLLDFSCSSSILSYHSQRRHSITSRHSFLTCPLIRIQVLSM